MGISAIEIAQKPLENVRHEPKITEEQATYKANNYLTKYVSVSFGAANPVLLPLERLTWQVEIYFQLPRMARFSLAFLDVDAETGEVVPFTDEQIDNYLYRANAYAKRHASSSARPS